MKTLRLLLAMILASLLSGCASTTIDGFVPAITASRLDYTRTGKFSSTQVKVENLRREGDKVKADKLEIHHSNAWIPNVAITVEGYERSAAADEPAKK